MGLLQGSARCKVWGVYIGNSYLSSVWDAPCRKLWSRVSLVSSLSGSWSTQALTYRIAAVSVLGYVMQFVHLPPKLLKDESAIPARIMKVPRNAIPQVATSNLEVMGLPSFPSLALLAKATMARVWMQLRDASVAAEAIA